MIENALDRLFKESEHDNDVPKYSMEEQMEDEENEPSFLDSMSGAATDLLKSKIEESEKDSDDETMFSGEDKTSDENEEKIEEEQIEEVTEAPKEEFKHIEKVTLDAPSEPKKPQSTKGKKKMANKKELNGSKADELMSNLANECIDIMIQSGVTIHNFSEEQMQIIWAHIREKLNVTKN